MIEVRQPRVKDGQLDEQGQPIRFAGKILPPYLVACLTMVFKLVQCTQRHWRRLNGQELIVEVIRGVRFTDGVRDVAAELASEW